MNESSSTNLWLFLETVARRRGLIFTLVLLVTAAAVVIALVLPKWYTATALLLPPSSEGEYSNLAQLVRISQVTGSIHPPGTVTPNDIYARMLTSRRVTDRLIEKFDLARRYKTSLKSDTYLALRSHTNIGVSDEGLLSIAVEDREPQAAADLVTAYVKELIALNRSLQSATAKQKREFIEERVEQVAAQLDSARAALEKFQLENRTVNIDEQVRLATSQAIQLKIGKSSLELDIKINEQVMGPDNPELVEKRQRLSILNSQLEQLEWGGQGDDSSFFSLPVAKVPNLRGRLESLYTRVRVNESLWKTLLELYEQARIQEEEQSPTIAVLDWPVVPDLRSRPQRTLIVLAAFAGSLLVALLLAAWLEYLVRLREKEHEDYNRLLLFLNAFFGWLPGIKKPVDRQQ